MTSKEDRCPLDYNSLTMYSSVRISSYPIKHMYTILLLTIAMLLLLRTC